MSKSLNRNLAELIDGTGSAVAGGLTVYATKENLPSTGLTSGDQAYVTNSSRFYISNGSGWYNVALVNANPALTISPSGVIVLDNEGSATTITLTGTDSDNAVAGLTFSVESDGDFFKMATLSQDSSVFTITPRSKDSYNTLASDGTATLTFKASDGVSFGTGTSALTLAFAIQYSQYTTMLLKADTGSNDNQVDASSNSHTITELGNVTSSALSPYHPGGYSYYFDGNDYISIADGTYKTLGSDPWTYECWVYPTSVAAGNKWILGDHASSGSATTTSVNLVLNGANFGIFCRTSAASNISVNESTTRSVNQWYHLALVFDQTNVILYVDGTAVITQAHTGGFNDGSGSFSVGRTGDYNGAYYTGYVRDVRLVKGTAVYTSSFTPPVEALTAISGTEILLCHLPYIRDGSTNDLTVTTGGTPQAFRYTPYEYENIYSKSSHAGSIYCDGTGDGFQIASATATQFGTGEWTIEGWFYPYDQAATQVLLYGYEGAYATTPGTYELYVGTNGAQTTPQINGNNGSWATSATSIGSTETFKYLTWNHIVWSRSGNNLRIFVNGKSGANHAISSSQTYDMKRSESQFMDKDGASGYKGYVSDLRVVKGSAVYTSDFTPPTQPLTAITNTQLLTCTNKNDIWDAGDGKLITKNGNAVVSNTKRKFTTSSAMYFDGTGDWLHTAPSSNLLTMGTGDFTIECWLWKADTNHRGIFQIGSNAAGLDVNYAGSIGFGYQVGVWQIYAANTAISGSSFTLTSDTWYHAAMVRNSGTTKLYIDGSEEISVADTHNYVGTYMAIGGYYTTGYLHNGYIQDLRVTKGLARYTTNFTPPTLEFSV